MSWQDLSTQPTTVMDNLFENGKQLQDVSALANWDTSNVTDMNCLFENCRKLDNISALTNWDVSNL